MGTIFNGLAQLVLNTENLAKLGAIAAWVFFTLVLIGYIIWLQRIQANASKQAWSAREAEAAADNLMANAVGNLRDELRELRYKIKCGGPSA